MDKLRFPIYETGRTLTANKLASVLEVTEAPLAEESLLLGFGPIRVKATEVFDPGVVVFEVKKVNFCRRIVAAYWEKIASSALVVVVPENVDADADWGLDLLDIGGWYRILKQIQSIFFKESDIMKWAVRVPVMAHRMKSRDNCVGKALVVLVPDIDDRLLICQEFGQFLESGASDPVVADAI